MKKYFFTDKEKFIGNGMFKKIRNEIIDDHEWLLAEFKDLQNIFTKEETEIIKKIMFGFSLSDFGMKGEYFGINYSVPDNLMPVENQVYIVKGKKKFVKIQYLPVNVLQAFQLMNKAMELKIGRRLNVVSGYRSPVYQAIVFFYNLYRNNWDMDYSVKRVALPGYSEHGYLPRLGIDFGPVESIPELRFFHKTDEYQWLCGNAEKFGFHLSYKENNRQGFIFEPWHWHYRPFAK